MLLFCYRYQYWLQTRLECIIYVVLCRNGVGPSEYEHNEYNKDNFHNA